MGKLVLVCVGGALGSGARFLVASWMADSFGSGFPTATLLVNFVGSFCIAVILGLSLRSTSVSPALRLFLTTGVMGGFTTYSSFNYEMLRLVERGAVSNALLYLTATVLGCLAAGAAGLTVARLVARGASGATP